MRNCIRRGKFEITFHADEEAQEDNVSITDIKNAILTGKIIKKFIDEPRGIRYKIAGETLDGRKLIVICRFNNIGEVRIITVFVKEKQ